MITYNGTIDVKENLENLAVILSEVKLRMLRKAKAHTKNKTILNDLIMVIEEITEEFLFTKFEYSLDWSHIDHYVETTFKDISEDLVSMAYKNKDEMSLYHRIILCVPLYFGIKRMKRVADLAQKVMVDYEEKHRSYC